jgi:hypothetical protein
MSHFAKLDENNVVVFVTVGRQEDDGKENEVNARTTDIYRQTSYNTLGGVHYTTDVEGNRVPSEDQSRAFRKNYAGIGFTYDEERDAFIPPQPFESWVLNEETCLWEAPVPMPEGAMYTWDEETGAWIEMEDEVTL